MANSIDTAFGHPGANPTSRAGRRRKSATPLPIPIAPLPQPPAPLPEPPDDERAPGSVIAAHPDAGLLGWCAALIAMEAQWRKTVETEYNNVGHPPGYNATLEAATNTPAKTDEGNRAKLAVVVSFYEPDPPDDGIVDEMMWDAISALALPPSARAVVAASTDPELLALCTEFWRHQEACDAWEGDEIESEEFEAINSRWWSTMEAVCDTPATTPHGLRAKVAVLQKLIGVVGNDENAIESFALSIGRDVLALPEAAS